MNKRLLVPITIFWAIFGASQLVLATIATDFANGVEPTPATEGAKSEGVIAKDAVVQLIAEDVEPTEAVKIVGNVYGLSAGGGSCSFSGGNAAYNAVVAAAINALPEGADPAPLNALFAHCPPTPGAVEGGGTPIRPS